MNKFEEDFRLAEKAIPHQNRIYQVLFDNPKIVRFSKTNRVILDRKYHIDVELELGNGIKLLGQEKALRFKFIKFNTFTIEFYQDRYTKEKGEFFNLGAQFYLHSYWNEREDGFCRWVFIKVFDFLEWLKKKDIEELEEKTRPSTSNASFYYIRYDEIPAEFVYSANL